MAGIGAEQRADCNRAGERLLSRIAGSGRKESYVTCDASRGQEIELLRQ
jgi:hypothetical protein